MRLRIQSLKRGWFTALVACACLVVGSAEVSAQARRAKVPTEYPGFQGTNWVEMLDGKSLTGWIPLELGGSGPVELETDFIPENQKDAKPCTIVRINRGDMLSGMAWTNGPVRMDYELEWKAMRVDGNDFFAAMSFPVRDSYVTFVPSGWGGSVGGISSINGHDASENETSTHLPLKDQTWYTFKVRVTEKKIEAWVDDKRVVNVLTEGKELGLRSGSPSEIQRYGLVCTAYRTTGAIKEMRMRKLKTPAESQATSPSEPKKSAQ